MNEILQYLGGGSVISGLLLWWVKSTISTLSAKIEKSENDNIKQEGDIKRLQEDVKRIKDKIYK
jgi:hypothetical protein|tara:strand:+ start:3335 stop:3526 length:192 start_codon:yes stop_codon:yes gene_type:complete